MPIKGLKKRNSAWLVLADGTMFSGDSIGATGQAVGEVVFNTAMTGYQEILSDPSYAEQIVTLTYPHIGNVGMNTEDMESQQVWAKGLVIRELSPVVSNWRSEQSLEDFLQANNIVAIANVDTRQLTRHLREHGAQNGCIISGDDTKTALKAAQAFEGLNGMDLAKVVSCKDSYHWTQASIELANPQFTERDNFHVVVYDFGVKHNILRLLIDAGCKVTVVPAQTSSADVLALNPDGVFLSNGPGDPAACDYAIKAAQDLLAQDMPLFGICLGCQILALASGAQTFKMKFGHHGANHPVQDLSSKRVYITSQNHGFAVDESTLPQEIEVTHRSLFDQTIQGIKHSSKSMQAFQGHPEASPGPHDIQALFEQFILMMRRQHAKA